MGFRSSPGGAGVGGKGLTLGVQDLPIVEPIAPYPRSAALGLCRSGVSNAAFSRCAHFQHLPPVPREEAPSHAHSFRHAAPQAPLRRMTGPAMSITSANTARS